MLFLILLAASHLPTKIGNVDFTKPCTYLFDKKDVKYLPNGSFKVKRATVWNAIPIAGTPAIVPEVIGDLPKPPKDTPKADLSKPLKVTFDSRFCKPKGDRAVCYNLIFDPRAIQPKEWRSK